MPKYSHLIFALPLAGLIACGGGSGSSEPPANVSPTANAPQNFSAVEATSVNLQGSGTDSDGSITSYSWTQTSGSSVTLENASAATASFTAPDVDADTDLTFTLTVTDDDGDTGSDTVVVTITPDQAPTTVAPDDFSAVEEQNVILDGSQSSDDVSIASYLWEQTSGDISVTLTNADTVSANFDAPTVTENTELGFSLTATDSVGQSSTGEVVVTITPDQPPQAVAPADFSTTEGSTVSLDGSGSSDDVAIVTYLWEQVSGTTVTIDNSDAETASFTAPEVAEDSSEVLAFSLTVTDANGASSSDQVSVTINDAPDVVTLSGRLTFDLVPNSGSGNLDYDNISQEPIRGATVELLDSSDSSIIESTTSDSDGNYSFDVTPSSSVVLRIKSEYKQTATASWDFTVVDNTSDDAVYAMDSATISIESENVSQDLNAPSGWSISETEYTGDRVAAPFAILDSVYKTVQKFVAVDADINFPALRLHWSENNRAAGNGECTDYDSGEITTSFYTTNSGCPGIYILGNADSDTDEYDGHIIIHEWGHYFEDKISRSDSIGGSHRGSDRLDLRVAMGEGFGNALSGIITDDPVYEDSSGDDQGSGFTINVESNPSTNRGWYSEASVQSLLYDFYDSNDDGSDNLSLGLAPIYQALINGEKDTDALTSIFSFAIALKEEASASSSSIDSLLSSQDIIADDDFGSNETNDGGDSRNLPVYKVATVGGASVEVCSFDTNGNYNKLGNRQFVRVDINTDGTYRFRADGQNSGDNPSMVVYKQGEVVLQSRTSGNENSTVSLTSGIHIIDVYENSNVSGNSGKDTCIDVSVSS